MADGTREPGPRLNDLTIYDDAADIWWSGETRWVRALHNLVPARLVEFDKLVEWRDKRVLDLGCAGGFMAEAIDDRGATVTGIDPAEKAIAAAAAHARETGREIRYDVGVGEALPYDDAAFDIVVCVDVLEHVSDLGKVLDEVARVLAPGGMFLFDTINDGWMARLAVVTMGERLLRLLPRGTHDPALFIAPQRLKSMLAERGLAPGRISGLGPRGINRRGDVTFGRVPMTGVLYLGSAVKGASASGMAGEGR